jgi:tetratricopeptide (TPR) repeat protein
VREHTGDPHGFAAAVADGLVRAAAPLERGRAFRAAQSLYELATELLPDCARTALHAGRAAREAGDRAAALAYYGRVRALDGDRLARLAGIGEALLVAGTEGGDERRISAEIRQAIRSGDDEMAGVGLEARALVRCANARACEAIRDLCACALRYPDPDDRMRVTERVAALLLSEGDLIGSREALLLLLEIGDARHRERAQVKLHRVSELLGDTMGVRRWHATGNADSAEMASQEVPPGRRSRTVPLPILRVWRDAVVGAPLAAGRR